jgi:CBS domain-containing protein
MTVQEPSYSTQDNFISSILLPMSSCVGDLVSQPLLTCAETMSIQAVAESMTAQHVNAAIILAPDGQPSGIVTDWDLRERVIVAKRPVSQPIRNVMSTPLVTIPIGAPIYEAIRLMSSYSIHHLVIINENHLNGVITSYDLLTGYHAAPSILVKEIETQSTLAGLRNVMDQVQQLLFLLLKQGIKANHLGWLMADLNDRLVMRVLELTEIELGTPPVPYCWLVLGSEGRREQTFKTDQDNALIYSDHAPAAAAVQAYFLEFAKRVVANLIEIGFPPCKGHYTADNPNWNQSLTGWCAHFQHWATSWRPEDAPNFLIFFDFRGIHGDFSLANQLHDCLFTILMEHPNFLNRLAHLSASLAPPLGFFGQFLVEHNGEHRDEFDLKLRGTVPLVDLARFFALSHHLAETNTLNRLKQLTTASNLPHVLIEELIQAFEFIFNLRLQYQWQQHLDSQVISNYINPENLSHIERRSLQEAFKVIAKAQAYLHKTYHLHVSRLY